MKTPTAQTFLAFEQTVVFANVVIDKGEFVRVYTVGRIADDAGHPIPGQIGYSFEDFKKRKPEERQPEQQPRRSVEDFDRDAIARQDHEPSTPRHRSGASISGSPPTPDRSSGYPRS